MTDACDRLVMIVEDDRDVRELLAELVADEGFCTLAAANGREALDLLEQAKVDGLPCVILLDILMPIVDGWQFRAMQENDATLAGIPVVVLSAHADGPTAAQRMRAAGFVRKPVDLDTLLDVIRDHC
ncbi:response regulator [Sandaracinus amylolyticus]|uniref:Response regulator receiver protein n=1 Tax=Sandaracinus amylolyticus TaxID=927083 RepID=A0A0F6SH29_9BACT|nr:response regulator [Sandaracinus amylolyticus]AKF09724.1 Response regulator receiver protein [Sandaracinus amylolyticus]